MWPIPKAKCNKIKIDVLNDFYKLGSLITKSLFFINKTTVLDVQICETSWLYDKPKNTIFSRKYPEIHSFITS